MSTQKLLRSPARLLLLSLVAASQVAIANVPAARRAALAPLASDNQAAPARSRGRPEPLFQGVERWGLNE